VEWSGGLGTTAVVATAVERPPLQLIYIKLCVALHCEFSSIRCIEKRYTHGGRKKRGHRFMTIILSVLKRFKKFFFTGRFLGTFAIKRVSKLPPHLAYIATL